MQKWSSVFYSRAIAIRAFQKDPFSLSCYKRLTRNCAFCAIADFPRPLLTNLLSYWFSCARIAFLLVQLTSNSQEDGRKAFLLVQLTSLLSYWLSCGWLAFLLVQLASLLSYWFSYVWLAFLLVQPTSQLSYWFSFEWLAFWMAQLISLFSYWFSSGSPACLLQ